MKQFQVIGLCKREYRGKGHDTTLESVIEADSKKDAEWKFEKANPEYNPAVVNELPKSKTKAKDIRDDDRLTSDGADIESDEADSENKE